jgi:2-methylcitrate dehydratase PrpD
VAIGGSHHETVDVAVSALQPFSGPPQAGLFGRTERFDIMNAAFLNGVSSHIFDFDDTHLKTIIHPAGPVASAILAYAAMKPVSGKEFLDALVVGSRPSAGSATRSTRTTTTPAGTSPAPADPSAPPRRPAS